MIFGVPLTDALVLPSLMRRHPTERELAALRATEKRYEDVRRIRD
jgi:hypothetical protein